MVPDDCVRVKRRGARSGAQRRHVSRPAQVRNNSSTPAGARLPLLSPPPPRLLAFASPPSAPTRVVPLRCRNRAQLRQPPRSRRIKSLAPLPRPARLPPPRPPWHRDGANGGRSWGRGQRPGLWEGVALAGPSAVPGASWDGGSPWGSPRLPRPRLAGATAPSAAPVLVAAPQPGRGSPGALPAGPAGAQPCVRRGRPEPPGAGSPRVLSPLAQRRKTPGAPFPPKRFLLGIVPAMLPTCRSLSAPHSLGGVCVLAGNKFWRFRTR